MRMRSKAPTGSPGFTLIEMLVVIALIGILASLLLPVLSKASGKAKATYCSSGMRQIGMSAQMWANEKRGQFPVVKVNSTTLIWDKNRTIGFGDMLKSEMRHEERMFVCPSASLLNKGYTNGVQNVGVKGKRAHSSYYFRGTNQQAPKTANDSRGNVLMSDFDAPSTTEPGQWMNQNHERGKNALFRDGHVEFIRCELDSRYYRYGGNSSGKKDGTWYFLDWQNYVGSATNTAAEVK